MFGGMDLYVAMDKFEEEDLLPESLEEVPVELGVSLSGKDIEEEDEGDIILSGSRKKRVSSGSKAVEVDVKQQHGDDEEDLKELVTENLEEQLNVSSEDERLAKGKQSKTKSTQEKKSKLVSESRDEKKSLSD